MMYVSTDTFLSYMYMYTYSLSKKLVFVPVATHTALTAVCTDHPISNVPQPEKQLSYRANVGIIHSTSEKEEMGRESEQQRDSK